MKSNVPEAYLKYLIRAATSPISTACMMFEVLFKKLFNNHKISCKDLIIAQKAIEIWPVVAFCKWAILYQVFGQEPLVV